MGFLARFVVLTLIMMGHAVEKAGRGVMSYSKYTRMLTN